MPILSRFYGIVIRMYFQQAEHNPPHIHALYGDDMAEIVIQSGEVLEGHLPPKALSMVREWVELHKADRSFEDVGNAGVYQACSVGMR